LTIEMGSWSAGCGASRTPGSGGGPGKRNGRKRRHRAPGRPHWATEALDEVRREAWNDARKLARTEPKRGRGRPRADAPARPGSGRATALKGARYSWKNPENLSENQQIKLAWIAATDPRLYRAYLLN